MGLTLIKDSVIEPLTLADVKVHLRVDGTDDDENIKGIIRAARAYCERRTRLVLLNQDWLYTLDAFPNQRAFVLPKSPLQSVSRIVYYDSAGVEQTMPKADYIVDTHSFPGRIAITPNEVWPHTEVNRINAVSIYFTAGHGLNQWDSTEPGRAGSVPSNIIQGMKLIIEHWNRERGAMVVGSISKELEHSVSVLWGLDAVEYAGVH